MKRSLLAFALAASVALTAGTGRAATTVYAQLPLSGAVIDTSAVHNVPSDPGFTWSSDSDSQAWAYFTPTSTASFDTITWYGSNADGAFAVDLFGATCFSCGLSFVKTNGKFTNNMLLSSNVFSGSSVTKTALGSNLYSYSITLPTALAFQAGGSYAFSVVNNYTALPFLWAGSTTGPGQHINYVVGRAIVLRAPGNLAFAFTSNAATTVPPSPVTAVPEPASWSLMILGFGAVGYAMRRKRAPIAVQAA